MAGKTQIDGRIQRILDALLRSGSITVDEICAEFGTSVATARRDLRALERQGRLRRIHGGAIAVEPLLYEPFRHVSTFQEQIERHAEEKRRIALAAAELIEAGDTIALTPGTTTTQVSRSVPSDKHVTVVTNTVNVAMELRNRPGVKVFVTGGFLHEGWFSLVGPTAVQAMSQIFVDKAFIGANGVDAVRGVTAYHPDEAALNSVTVRQARTRIVVADNSKIGVVATHLICAADQVDILITDTGAPDDAVAPFLERGIEVRRV